MAYFQVDVIEKNNITFRMRKLSEAASAYNWFDVEINGRSGPGSSDRISFRIYNSDLSFSSDGTGYLRTNYVTAYQLTEGTTYRMYVSARTNASYPVESEDGGSYFQFTTLSDSSIPPKVTGISVSHVTANSVRVSWNPSPGTYEYRIRIWEEPSGSHHYSEYTYWTYIDIVDLMPGGQYSAWIYARNEDGDHDGYKEVYFQTLSNPRPSNWNWEFTITSGQPFYNQVGDTVYLMRAAHWNAFTTRINEFRTYKGLSSYSFTTATTSTTEIGIRNCINQTITAINAMGFSQSSIVSGGLVYANIFTTMRSNLNSL